MAISTSSSYAGAVESYFNSRLLDSLTYSPGSKWVMASDSNDWQPPIYTSLTGWLFMNYAVIGLFGVLVSDVTYVIMHYGFGWVF